jgi:hypothetical protein
MLILEFEYLLWMFVSLFGWVTCKGVNILSNYIYLQRNPVIFELTEEEEREFEESTP